MKNLGNLNTKNFKQKLEILKTKLNIKDKKQKIKELREQSLEPDFWKDHLQAGKAMQELADFQGQVKELETLSSQLKNKLSPQEIKEVQKKIAQLENKVFLLYSCFSCTHTQIPTQIPNYLGIFYPGTEIPGYKYPGTKIPTHELP